MGDEATSTLWLAVATAGVLAAHLLAAAVVCALVMRSLSGGWREDPARAHPGWSPPDDDEEDGGGGSGPASYRPAPGGGGGVVVRVPHGTRLLCRARSPARRGRLRSR